MRKYTIALALAFVTAAVTFPGGGTGGAQAQLAGEYRAVITNMRTGKQSAWTRKTWPDQARCDAALGNANAVLRAVADPNPDVKVPDYTDTVDKELGESLDVLVFTIFSNTGKLPDFSISCELPGDPA